LTRIGTCMAGGAVLLKRGGVEADLPRGAYLHFGA
jgi:hypothetical protein